MQSYFSKAGTSRYPSGRIRILQILTALGVEIYDLLLKWHPYVDRVCAAEQTGDQVLVMGLGPAGWYDAPFMDAWLCSDRDGWCASRAMAFWRCAGPVRSYLALRLLSERACVGFGGL